MGDSARMGERSWLEAEGAAEERRWVRGVRSFRRSSSGESPGELLTETGGRESAEGKRNQSYVA